MQWFPDSALVRLEFDQVKLLLEGYCLTDFAKDKANTLAVWLDLHRIERELNQSQEAKLLHMRGQRIPYPEELNLSVELRLMEIPGAALEPQQWMKILQLLDSSEQLFRWFDADHRAAYPALTQVIQGAHYNQNIAAAIKEIFDPQGEVRDQASADLASIRSRLSRLRQERRKAFDRILSRLIKSGYLAESEEAFLNGRRVVALLAEHKRQVKGILHGESDTRRTAFIEPEETIELNNAVFSMELAERREIRRLLAELTARLSIHAPLLKRYYDFLGEFDFITAKGRLAASLGANLPRIHPGPALSLREAVHPLLLLHNRKNLRETVPISLHLDETNRILLISGPNAGGKTVTLKMVGLLQLMLQAGLLIPAHPDSELGLFNQLMIHLGDAQSLEFELSTYSAQLRNLKYFLEHADGDTLFFIDELGSGSDPSLGGAFAEVILEELVKRRSMGIVTTHYLNLKIMAGKTPGIINGAMAFDDQALRPLYRLISGRPGSSYTFSIAERIGLAPELLERARELVDAGHFLLDSLLNRTEQDLQALQQERQRMQELIRQNEGLKQEMETVIRREKQRQQVELLRQQHRLTEDRIDYLKEMERKLRQIVVEWQKNENKGEVIRHMQALLVTQKEKQRQDKQNKKLHAKYAEVDSVAKVGDQVIMKKNRQVGTVRELRGKKAVVQVGLVPITVGLTDLAVVRDLTASAKNERSKDQ
jgi:DNA mismatch repair protein MutS2